MRNRASAASSEIFEPRQMCEIAPNVDLIRKISGARSARAPDPRLEVQITSPVDAPGLPLEEPCVPTRHPPLETLPSKHRC